MADYSKEEIRRIEDKWRSEWEKRGVYKTTEDPDKPKYYALDMFPYPSGAGLHVGHPLGYIACDIVARFKRIKGFNVLHPMGFDAFGLPAEQYAIQTGQHPAITTAQNIETYKRQLRQIGFSFDWSREVRTSDPNYYKWTQWIFMQLFNAWYNKKSNRTERIDLLIKHFDKNGNKDIDAACDEDTPGFTAQEWSLLRERQKENILQKYRIAYQSEAMVNWCAALGTVLSNDEIKDGVSERGGYPVERIKMLQWSMRITAYAERLLSGLEAIDWPEPLKEMQRNWIGKSEGAKVSFNVRSENSGTQRLVVFTTRPDTIFGVDFMVVAPEHEIVKEITSKAQEPEVVQYLKYVESRSEVDRMAEVKKITGCFTGAFAVNPFNNREIPIWISEYVLAGYGTGAIMAVPCGDERDHKFAKHFDLPITNIIGRNYNGTEANPTYDAVLENSDFLNGMIMKDAIPVVLNKLELLGIGVRKINYKMRDAVFGRQRYWGEPFPVYFKNGIPKLVEEKDLPITLPQIDAYKPTESGEPPLARARDWRYHLTPALSGGEGVDSGFEGEIAQDYIFTTDEKTWKALKENVKENRRNSTEAEEKLWQEVRNSKLGSKFRRQHVIGRFIADFVCIEKKLVVEIDGPIHEQQKEADKERTKTLNHAGFQVIRFTNDEVVNQLTKVLTKIKQSLSSPSPPAREPEGEVYPFELTTMPGWAGSSWYWYRYMDPHNENEFCSRKKESYWKDVDLYIGGSEHATGHLMYSRFWNKAMKDLGLVEAEEPFRKLINQGHILGVSQFINEIRIDPSIKSNYEGKEVLLCVFANEKLLKEFKVQLKEGHHQYLSQDVHGLDFKYTNIETGESILTKLHESRANVKYFDEGNLNIVRWLQHEPIYKPILFVNEGYWHWGERQWKKFDGADFPDTVRFETRPEVEKMSKSYVNVINPDDIIDKYGADTLRMHEMFLGPLEQSKPWNTNGIDGVYKFLRRFWNLFHDPQGNFKISKEEPSREELKVLHKTLKKVEQDIENFSFNTSVSEFMICANELTSLKCNKVAILEPLVIALSPFAPHIAEELWEKLGHTKTILEANFMSYDEQYLKENSFDYPISINGKVRTTMNFALDMPKSDIEKLVLASETVQKWSEGKPPKKVIIVQGKIVNVVL